MRRANTNSASPSANAPAHLLGIRYFLMLWLLFFAICFGLGYATLSRYDPRTTAGLTWSLLTGKRYQLPMWGVLGALAKETFVPFSCVFAFTWWLMERRQTRPGLSQLNWAQFKWIAALAVVGLATVMTIHSAVAGQLEWPWDIASQARAPVNFFIALWNCLTERSFWYVFGWLIPLGIWRLKYFPTPWLVASLSTSAVAILLGAYSNAGGTVGRATFNIIGPLLSLSVALLIARPSDYLAPVKSELNS